jgi:phage terminase large subunit-like protein
VAVFPFFWVPEQTAIKREREKRIPYSVWAKSGHLTLCPGEIIGAPELFAEVMQIIERYKLNVTEMPVDRAFQGLNVIMSLVAEGLTAFPHGQGSLGMIPPTKQTKNLILAGKLKHDGHPVMRWMMNNVVVHPGDNKEYPMRDKSADKIDGPVAMIMGVGRAVMQPAPQESFYETHGLEVGK